MGQSEPIGSTTASREALNAAFWELGLRFQWDAATWHMLVELDDLQAQLRYYLEHWQPHLLAVYDPPFLASLVEKHLAAPGNSRTGMEAQHRA